MSSIIRFCTTPTDKLALIWLVVVTFLSLTPLEAAPAIHGSDKLGHFAAYLLLGFFSTLSRKSPQTLIWTLSLILLYSGLIELIQPYVNRHMEFGDFAANASGAVCGGAIAYAFWKYRKMNSRRLN